MNVSFYGINYIHSEVQAIMVVLECFQDLKRNSVTINNSLSPLSFIFW